MALSRREARLLIVELVSELNRVGSWSGATHVQKCTFFAREMAGIPVPYEFVIYHYGPFSFDLDEDLALMRFEGWLEITSEEGYGVHYHPGRKRLPRFPNEVEPYRRALKWVAERFGVLDAKRLELLATTYYVQRRMAAGDRPSGRETVISTVRRLKPHFADSDVAQAMATLQEAVRAIGSLAVDVQAATEEATP